MDMTGQHKIPAPRQTVWEALNDPDVLKACIPGCEEIERTSDNGFTAKVSAKVGPVKAKFSGAVTLSDIDPPNGYTISGEGKGGAAGFAKGGAKVRLEDADAGTATLLSYEVNASVGGKLAQIGARLIDSTAKKYANDFFENFTAIAAERGGGAAAPGNVEAGVGSTPTPAPAPAESHAEPVQPQPVEATRVERQPVEQQPVESQSSRAHHPVHQEETHVASTHPLKEEMKRLGIPEENVYPGLHWSVIVSWGAVLVAIALFLASAVG